MTPYAGIWPVSSRSWGRLVLVLVLVLVGVALRSVGKEGLPPVQVASRSQMPPWGVRAVVEAQAVRKG